MFHFCVGQHIVDYIGDLLFQFIHKLRRIILTLLNIAQFLLPDTREFATLEQFLFYCVYELDACGCGHEVLSLAANVMAFEECFDYAGT